MRIGSWNGLTLVAKKREEDGIWHSRGLAILVPLMVFVSLGEPGHADLMSLPGA